MAAHRSRELTQDQFLTTTQGHESQLAVVKHPAERPLEMLTSSSRWVWLSERPIPRGKKEEAYQALVTPTKEICAYAESKGDLKIAREVFDYDIDKCSLDGPVDLSPIPIIHETIRDSILPVKDCITHAHMTNSMMTDRNDPACGNAHPHFGYPGSENGVEDLVEFLQMLMEIGYPDPANHRFLSFEVKPVGDEDSDIVIDNAKQVLNLAWAQL